MKAAIYARYSSDLQNAKSADDQIDACQRFVTERGGEVVLVEKDEAISGTSYLNRPGIQALLNAAKNGAFDTLVAEAIDRISRDEEHMAHFRKRLDAVGVRIVTINDGAPSRMEIGLKSVMSALYIEELSKKTKRGQRAALEHGRIPGGKCYGYDVDPTAPSRRQINEHEADVVREIFEMYDRGLATSQIARRLNERGETSARGGVWRVNTLIGSKKGVNGLLRNNLYAGHFLFERNKFAKDPDTEKRTKKIRPESEWLRQDFPELRIIDDALWQRVQQRIADNSREYRAPPTKAKRLLSGLLKCGCCGAGYVVVNRGKVGCTGRKDGSCSNRRMALLADLEKRVLSGLQEHLLTPEAVEAAVAATAVEQAELRKHDRIKRNRLESELQKIERDLKRLTDLVLESDAPDALLGRMRADEARKSEIQAELDNIHEATVIQHPSAATKYRQIVAHLHEALALPTGPRLAHPNKAGVMGLARLGYSETDEARLAREAAYEAIRELIDEIRVFPDDPTTDNRGGGPVRLEVHGQLAALLTTADDCRSRLVAGVGFEPTTFRL